MIISESLDSDYRVICPSEPLFKKLLFSYTYAAKFEEKSINHKQTFPLIMEEFNIKNVVYSY